MPMPRLLPLTLLVFANGLATAQAADGVRFEVVAADACGGRPPLPAWEQELHERMPEFVALWQRVGPELAQAVRSITGQPFEPDGRVALTLCETPSNAFFGVTVNMRYALRSFTPSPVPLRYKVDTVFHELLHGFVGRTVPPASPALAAHASESRCVRNHLHLLALQKAVLLRTGAASALDDVVANDSLLPSGCYRRAWALVNETPDTYQRFVRELAP